MRRKHTDEKMEALITESEIWIVRAEVTFKPVSSVPAKSKMD